MKIVIGFTNPCLSSSPSRILTKTLFLSRPASRVHHVPSTKEVSRGPIRALRRRVTTVAKLPEALPSAASARLAPSVGCSHRTAQISGNQ